MELLKKSLLIIWLIQNKDYLFVVCSQSIL